MKTTGNFGIMYVLLLVGQVFICNYLHLSMYVTLSILPVLILFLPLSVGTVPAMFIAFISGLSVDLLSEAVLGLNTMALLPVALARKNIIRLTLGEEIVDRADAFSLRQKGFTKITWAIIVAQSIFFTIYILADGAGIRPLWFNLARFAASMAASWLIALLVVKLVASDE